MLCVCFLDVIGWFSCCWKSVGEQAGCFKRRQSLTSVHLLSSMCLAANSIAPTTCRSKPLGLSHRRSCVQCPVGGVMLPPAAWKLCQTFLVHGLTVFAVLSSHEWVHLPRDLDCVEIFAGVGSIAAAAAEKGLRTAAYDKRRISGVTEHTEDITTLQGFRTAIALVLRLATHGLLWLAPDCSSWGFMNSSRCQRSEANSYRGDVTYPKVIAGNLMAECSVFLILLAAARKVKAALENPSSSCFFKYGPVVDVANSLNMVVGYTYRCAFSVAPFGKRYKKKYKFLATGSWVRGVFAACRCPGNVHLPLCKTRVCKDGRVQKTGIKARLTESGAYPIALGQRIVECACPGHADMGTTVGMRVDTKKVVQALKRVRKSYTKKRTSAVSSVTRVASKKNEPVSTARSWTTPPASSGTCTSQSPLIKARAWCTPSASSTSSSSSAKAWCTPSVASPAVNAHTPPVSSNGGKKRSWCTPAATSSSQPSARAAHRAWLEP